MTIKISELPAIDSGNLTVAANTAIAVVSDYEGDSTTYRTTVANIKTYVETGTLDVSQEVFVRGNLWVDGIINGTTSGGTSNVVSAGNFVNIQTDANLALPASDNGRDVGLRSFYYKTAGDVAALVWKNSNSRLTWFGNGVGNAATSISAGATLGTMEVGVMLVSNTTISTSTGTGALVVSGGAGIQGNVTATRVITPNLTATAASVTGQIQAGSIRSNSFSTIQTTLVTGGTATLNAVNVNGAATVGTTLTTSGTATVNRLASNGNVSGTGASFSGAGVFAAGIQNTTIGNVVPKSATFTTLTVQSGANFDNVVGVDGLLTTNGIIPFGNANVSIGSPTKYYQTVYAQATSALYADLAEKYEADAEYPAGTVVVFGGDKEITTTIELADTRVAGAISTDPAYIMNSGSDGIAVALRGKVPVNVIGPVTKGDLLITAKEQGYACSAKSYPGASPNAVFAKSLETDLDSGQRLIWAVIV